VRTLQATNGSFISHGFLLSYGVYTTIDVPGAVDTFAEGINNLGQIAGYYVDASGNDHGFPLVPPRARPPYRSRAERGCGSLRPTA
jgi:hypothetical protein